MNLKLFGNGAGEGYHHDSKSKSNLDARKGLTTDGDAIASIVLAKYASLGRKGKPLVRSNGVIEGTVLAGVVLHTDDSEECVAMATGVKALPDDLVARASGSKLHDCHAEILALRAFNRYLLENLGDPRWMTRSETRQGTFQARLDLRIYLYVSAAPCGDASISLLAAAAMDEAESWAPPPPSTLWLRGRDHFDAVGYIRTKPGRRDSPLTMSKSCTDKLALRQVTGLLQSCLHHVLDPEGFYLNALIIPEAELRLTDFERAFGRWAPRHRFAWWPTRHLFQDRLGDSKAASPVSLIWLPSRVEVVANGIKQGSRNAPSIVSRREIAILVISLLLKDNLLSQTPPTMTYGTFKRAHKHYPAGWIRTSRDDFEIPIADLLIQGTDNK